MSADCGRSREDAREREPRLLPRECGFGAGPTSRENSTDGRGEPGVLRLVEDVEALASREARERRLRVISQSRSSSSSFLSRWFLARIDLVKMKAQRGTPHSRDAGRRSRGGSPSRLVSMLSGSSNCGARSRGRAASRGAGLTHVIMGGDVVEGASYVNEEEAAVDSGEADTES